MEKIITPVKGPDKGKVKGKLVIDDNGDKNLYDNYGNLLVKFCADKNVTTNYYGKTIMKGDGLAKPLNWLKMLSKEKRKLNS